MTESPLPQSLAAGLLASSAGLLTFLAIHHLWIQPIWFILPVGFVLASIGGLAVGWAYSLLLPSLPPQPWTILAVITLITAILAPSLGLAELRPPIYDFSGDSAALVVSRGRAVAIFIGELVLPSILVGGLIGWWLRGTPEAAVSTALAGLAFALGPGHNIPLIGGTPGVWKEIAIIASVVIVSSIVLVGSRFLVASLQG